MPRYIQDRKTGKLIEVKRRPPPAATGPTIVGDIEPFASPVDGTTISSRAHLREHNRRHDVAQHGEYGENDGAEYFARQGREREVRYRHQTLEDREDRLRRIARSLDEQRRRR